MKKLILFLLPLLALAQNPTNFPYGIKNPAATSDSAPAYFTTTQVDGVHKKTPAALVAFKSDTKNNYITIASVSASTAAKSTANFVCDGVNDDVEINAAIQSLPAWGGRIQLTNGLFYINSSIVIDRAITLVGEGTGIAGRSVGNMYGSTEGITTLRASSDVDVIRIDAPTKLQGIKLADFILQGFGKDVSSKIGIYIKTETDVMQISGVNVLDCGIGIYGKANDASNIITSSFQYNALGGLIFNSYHVNINNCVFADNNGVATVTIDGVTHTVNTGGLAIGGANSNIMGSTFVRNDKGGTAYNSISILDAVGLKIDNCVIQYQEGNAIGIIGTSTGFAERTQISNNTIIGFGKSMVSGKRNGIYILKGHATHIFGNYIGSAIGFPTTSEYAVYEDRAVNTYTGVTLVKNNIFIDIQNSAKILLTGAQSNYIKNINLGEADTDNLAFVGLQTTTNTGASRINGIVLTQSGTNSDGVFNITNTTTGTAELKTNSSTGTTSRINNFGGGIGSQLVNYSTGVGYNGWNASTGVYNYSENQNTGVLSVLNASTSSTGDLLQFKKNSVITTRVDHNGMITTPPATLSNQVVVKSQLDLKSDLSSPTFTGTPLAPTATAGTNTTQIATTAFVQNGFVALTENQTIAGVKTFASSPLIGTGSLSFTDTDLFGDIMTIYANANKWQFSNTVGGKLLDFTNSAISFYKTNGIKADILSDLLTASRNYSLPDASGTLALTSDLTTKAPLSSPSLTGTPTAPTATVGTNTTQIATTAFVQNAMTSGTYVPTFTNTTNISSSTLNAAYYTKINNIITVTIAVQLTLTATADTVFTFSLPVSGATVVNGVGQGNLTSGGGSVNAYGIVDTTNSTTAQLRIGSAAVAGSGAGVANIIFTYSL